MLVLADLITRRQIGIEVVLAIEATDHVDVCIQAEPGAHRLGHAFAVDHRQHAGERRVDEADLRIGRRAKIRRRAGEQLGLADDVRVDFQADHHFPRASAAFDRIAHGAAPALICGSASKAAARSNAAPTASTVSSSNGLPITCNPSGKPLASSPAGTDMPGTPAMLAGTVNTSFKYILIGSSMLSPWANAADGAVGVTNASTLENTSVKSRRINARTFCARR